MRNLSHEEIQWLEAKTGVERPIDAVIYHLYDKRDNYERWSLRVTYSYYFIDAKERRAVCKYLPIKNGSYLQVRKYLPNAGKEEIDLSTIDFRNNRSQLYIRDDNIVMRWQ